MVKIALQILFIAGLIATSAACSTLASVHGARTLPPGAAQLGVAVSLQRGNNALSNVGIALPQTELTWRVGVAEDVDVGGRLYLLGAGVDARYRFYHQGPWHLAVDPGLSWFWLPLEGLEKQGSIETSMPVLAEWDWSEAGSLSGGPRVVLRDQFNGMDDPALGAGSVSRLDVFAGVGARLELRGSRWNYGISADYLGQPARHGGPAWSLGVDFSRRSRARDRGGNLP